MSKGYFKTVKKGHIFKKHSFALWILFFLVLQLSACKSEDCSYPLQQTIAKLEKDSNTISEDEWAKYDHEIEEMQQQLKNQRQDFTPQEVEKVNKLIGKYYVLKATRKVGKIKQELMDGSQQLEGVFETLLNKNHVPSI